MFSRWFAGHRRLEPTRRPWPRHQSERRKPITLLLVSPWPHPGPIPLHAEGRVERRDQRQARCVLAQPHARPLRRLFVTRPALPGRPGVAPGGLGERATSAARGGGHGAARSPAARGAGPQGPGAAPGASPVLQRASAPDRVRSSGGRLAPTPASSAPTARAAAPLDLGPRGSGSPRNPGHEHASATAAQSYDAPRNLGRWSGASAPDSPSSPPGTGHGVVERWWSCTDVPMALAPLPCQPGQHILCWPGLWPYPLPSCGACPGHAGGLRSRLMPASI